MSRVSFDISSIMLNKSNQKAIKPDKEGIYRKLPLLVLGKISRNNKDYDVNSMVEAISSPNSLFYKKLVAGQLEGEWWHPLTGNDESALARIAKIERNNVSHHIHRVYTGEPTEQGHVIVYGDIEPSGPYGPHLKESLESPRINTAFSLRSLVSNMGEKDGVIKQRVIVLVTIDAVDSPGYAEASKVDISSFENYSYEVDLVKHANLLRTEFGLEHINDPQIQDLLESDKITVGRKRYTFDVENKTLNTRTSKKPVFHELFRY
jgi:hypothetical protein